MKEIGPWKLLNDAVVYENPWIKVHHQEVINPNGNPGIYGKIHFKNLAIGIIALDDEMNSWLVGQYRYPTEQFSWEIPEGGGKIGIEPLESAKRELLEECGLKAETWTEIMQMHLSNSVSDELAIIYVARGLTQHNPEPEDTEQLEVKKVAFHTLVDMVMEGKITDSMSVAGILKAHLLHIQGKL